MENVRIKRLRNEFGKSQKELAELLNISQGAYSQIESGNTALSIAHGLLLSEFYDITLDWLATGKGLKTKVLRGGFIPLINSAVHAGYIKKGSEIFEESHGMYRIPGFTDGEYRIFEVEGNSMKPTLMPHDYLICSRMEEPYNFVDGAICTVITEGEVFVKRLYKHGDDDKKVVLKCDNKNFPSETYQKVNIREIWAVTAKLTTTFFTVNQDHEGRMRELEQKLESLEEFVNNLRK